ncbi:MAG: S8 family serine peptidase [Dehalococcoidia bacterium]
MLTRYPNRLIWGLFVTVALVALVARPEPVSGDSVATIHPAVQAFQQQHPGAAVPVIVQTADNGEPASNLAESVGAFDDLSLIGGFAAVLPPDKIEKLSRDPDVAMISLDAPMMVQNDGGKAHEGKHPDDDGKVDRGKHPSDDIYPASSYPFSVDADEVWDEGVTGDGVMVAVIDSGIAERKDFKGRVEDRLDFSSLDSGRNDRNGHGTYVAGVIAGESDRYTGIAPDAGLLSVKVANREGQALVSDVVLALQWVVDHKDEYNIRVVNISLNSSIPDSYLQNPLNAAVEQAWFHGIVVVVAAGNFGGEEFASDHAPANDPFVITVGAFDDAGTVDSDDDSPATWSSSGLTMDGYAKPEVVAPGVDIVSVLAGRGSYLAKTGPSAIVDHRYLSLSGTSSSSAVVSGIVALIIEQDPGLTPDDVKFRLMATADPVDGWSAPRVDADDAVFTTVSGEANESALPCDLIDPVTGEILYDSVLWNSVLWNSVLWNNVLWNNVLWNSVLWSR